MKQDQDGGGAGVDFSGRDVRVSYLHQVDGSMIAHATDLESGCVETSEKLRDPGEARAQALERLAWKVRSAK